MVTEINKESFAAALHQLLDEKDVPVRGRARYLNETLKLGLSDKACKKWLDAETFPTMDKLFIISKYFDFSLDELIQSGEIKPLSKNINISESNKISENLVKYEVTKLTPVAELREDLMLQLMVLNENNQDDAKLITAMHNLISVFKFDLTATKKEKRFCQRKNDRRKNHLISRTDRRTNISPKQLLKSHK